MGWFGGTILILLGIISGLVVVQQRKETIALNDNAFEKFKTYPINLVSIFIGWVSAFTFVSGIILIYKVGLFKALIPTTSISMLILYLLSKSIEKKTNKEIALKSTSIIFVYGMALSVFFVLTRFGLMCNDLEEKSEKRLHWYCPNYWW